MDFLDVERPSDLMFDVTEFKTAKQVTNLAKLNALLKITTYS